MKIRRTEIMFRDENQRKDRVPECDHELYQERMEGAIPEEYSAGSSAPVQWN